MPGPFPTPPHVAARRRRRQGSSSLFRTALALALVFTGGLALLTARSLVPNSEAKSTVVPVQVPIGGLESSACMGFAPSVARSGPTVFIDPGHGGLDPGVVTVGDGRHVAQKHPTLAIG